MVKDKITKVKIYINQKSPRMFHNKFLEFLTRSHPVIIDSMYAIIAFFLMRYYYIHMEQSIGIILFQFTLGFFSWTLAEYLMHRFLYHRPDDATYDTGIQYIFHGIHHYFPNDNSRTVLPPIPSLVIASIFFGVFYLIIGKYAFTFGAGFMIGYSSYMTLHYMIHKKRTPKKWSWWWNFHNIHHYQQHDRAFGVTSPIWDIIFRTMPEKNRKTVHIEVAKPGEDFIKDHSK